MSRLVRQPLKNSNTTSTVKCIALLLISISAFELDQRCKLGDIGIPRPISQVAVVESVVSPETHGNVRVPSRLKTWSKYRKPSTETLIESLVSGPYTEFKLHPKPSNPFPKK